ncbi:hypothetical protein PSKAS_32000 [Peribacillus sp. N1]
MFSFQRAIYRRSFGNDFNNISTILFFVNNFFSFAVDLVIISSIRNKSNSYFKINNIHEFIDFKSYDCTPNQEEKAYILRVNFFFELYSISSIYNSRLIPKLIICPLSITFMTGFVFRDGINKNDFSDESIVQFDHASYGKISEA